MKYSVYKHTSPSGKVYIGITSKIPSKRWNGGRGYITNDYFTKAINKYGWNNFTHEILFTDLSQEDAEKKEVELIAFYQSDKREHGYNIQHGGNSRGKHAEESKKKIGDANRGRKPWIYGNHHSEETKAKIREKHMGMCLSDETKEKISLANRGKKQSPETVKKRADSNRGKKRTSEQCKRISESLKGRTFSHTEETKNKISKTLSIPIICVETGIKYCGLRDAEKKTHVSSGTISHCLHGKYEKAGGYHWKYAD
jgi:group I intron endonuclease